MSSVLVVMEQAGGGGWHRISREALAAGKRLAKEMKVPCHAAVLGTNDAVKGAVDPLVVLVTWIVCGVGTDIDPASTLNEALLLESVIADVAEVTFSVTGM